METTHRSDPILHWQLDRVGFEQMVIILIDQHHLILIAFTKFFRQIQSGKTSSDNHDALFVGMRNIQIMHSLKNLAFKIFEGSDFCVSTLYCKREQ